MKKVLHHNTRNFKTCFFFLAFISTITVCGAQTRTLLALSKNDHMLAIVNPITFNIIARIPVGEDPHELIASPDGRLAYVCIYGGGSLYEINVIDLVAQKRLPNIDTRPLYGPHDITYVNNKVWFSAEGSKAIGRYDPTEKKLDWSMGTGQDRTHMLFVTANAKTIYTTNVSSGTVSILENTPITDRPRLMGPALTPQKISPSMAQPLFPNQARENWIQTVIQTSRGSEGFDVSPDGKELWTPSSEDGTIFIINLETKKLNEKIDAKVYGANRLKFTPNGKQVFISSLQTGDLIIYDVISRKEIKRLKLGHGAAGILMDPIKSVAFVACSADNYISVVDIKTLRVIRNFDVGGIPDGLAWAIVP